MTWFNTATIGALMNAPAGQSEGERRFNAILEEQAAQDPRARGPGFTYKHYDGPQDINKLEALGANEMRDAGTGAFRGMKESILAIANQEGLDERVAESRARAVGAAKRNEAQFERATRGQDLSERQLRAAKRRMGLNRAVTEAAAGSTERRTSAQNARDALKAGVDLEQTSFQQRLSGFAGLANAEGQRRIRKANEAAAKRAERNSWISTGIGAVLSIAAIAASSEDWKDKEEESPDLLSKLKGVRVDRWKYKGDKQKHVGPYAEEFNEAFGTGGADGDTRYINLIDAVGVALGAVKQLDQKLEALNAG